jgi:predicted transcriptional regulator
VLTVAETFAKESKKLTDFWDELSKEQKTAVNRAIRQAEEGKLTSHTEVMKKLRR